MLLERAAMGGLLVPAQPDSSAAAAELPADSAAAAPAAQLDAASEPLAELASPPAAERTAAADGQSAAAAQLPAEPDAGELSATAAEPADAAGTAAPSGAPLQGKIEGVPSVPCFHAFIHAHAAAGDLRSVSGLGRPQPLLALAVVWSRQLRRYFGVACTCGACRLYWLHPSW